MDQHDLDALGEKIAEAHDAEDRIVHDSPHLIHPDEYDNPGGGSAENPFSLSDDWSAPAPAPAPPTESRAQEQAGDEQAVVQDQATNQGADDLEDEIFHVGHGASDTD